MSGRSVPAGRQAPHGGSVLAPRASSNANSLARFQGALDALARRAVAIDLRGYEIADVERIAAELQPRTLGLVGEATELLGAVVAACEQLPAEERIPEANTGAWNAYLPFEHAVDATLAAKLGSHQAVDEIAFIAQLELRQRGERLGRIRAAQGSAVLLGECDSSLRRLRKAMTAVDAAIANVEGVAPVLDFSSELQTSLAIRRAYARFRCQLVVEGSPAEVTLRARFRAVGTQIAILVGWDVYREMRVQDRLLLRDLQRRILAWLRDDSASDEGHRLWQDFAACVEMFGLVNRRQELIAHDRELVRALLARDAAGALAGDAAWQAIAPLEGLDPELDTLLVSDTGPPLAAAVVVLRRLADGFDAARATGGSGMADPW